MNKNRCSFVNTPVRWESVRRGNWGDSILIDIYWSFCPAAVISLYKVDEQVTVGGGRCEMVAIGQKDKREIIRRKINS